MTDQHGKLVTHRTDPLCSARLAATSPAKHHLALVADAGPKVR